MEKEKERKAKRTDQELGLMMGGAKKFTKILLGIIAAVEAAGGTARDLEKLEPGKPGAEPLLGELAQFIVGKVAAPMMQVAWNIMLTWIIAACRFVSYVDPDITAEHFPLQPSDLTIKEVVTIAIERAMSTEAVLALLDSMGLRSATLVELLWWWLTNPDKQSNCLVVALGSVWAGQAPCVGSSGDYRELLLRSLAGDWRARCAFAAVRK